MKIKLIPERERPVERALSFGISTLSTSELIALIIRTGTSEQSAIALASEFLAYVGDDISDVVSLSPVDFMQVKGIGRVKACAISAAIELGRRVSSERRICKDIISGADDVAGMFMEALRYEKKEHFKTVILDTKGKVINVDSVSVGSLSSAPVHPREVFAPAIRKNAAAIVLVHNHPSGDPTPSKQDIQTTKRLCYAGKLLGIDVLDHIVIGDGDFSSMVSMGLM